MYRVHAPRKVDATIAGVKFTDGVAETDDPAALAYFRRHPYVIEALEARNAAGYPDGAPTDDWTGDELRAYATDHGVDLPGSARTKAAMVKAIEDATAPAPIPNQAPDGSAPTAGGE